MALPYGIQSFSRSPNATSQSPNRDILIGYNEKKQIMQFLQTFQGIPMLVLDGASVVIRIDGACRRNGMPGARASYGVYVGPNSRYNEKEVLPRSMPQTSLRAEIAALENGLNVLDTIRERYSKLTQITIASDCKSLVDGLNRNIERWRRRKGLNNQGKPVAHYAVFMKLYARILSMRYRVAVSIEHIPREMNTEADKLANDALDLAARARSVREVDSSTAPVIRVGYIAVSTEDFWAEDNPFEEEASWMEEEEEDDDDDKESLTEVADRYRRGTLTCWVLRS